MEIRIVTEKDFRITEEVTREAFWNFYVPGCNEHLILHKIRKSKDYIPELDLVSVKDGNIVGSIIYTHSKIIKENGEEQSVITFGPVSVLPEFQNQGIGAVLIKHSIEKAKAMGFIAVIIYGYPEYYKRFGFKSGIKFKISRSDGAYPKAMLILELSNRALVGIHGKFHESSLFEVSQDELEEFDKDFPRKEKFQTKSQEDFALMVEAMEEI